MATNNPLLVPINVEAFAVNQAMLDGDIDLQRWQFAYPFLNSYVSPQPKPFTGANTLPGAGVILHWELPEVLREGAQRGGSSAVDFPPVPNRWLVVRYSGPVDARAAVAWVVQSDALGNRDPVTGGSPYVQPDAATFQPTWIGGVVALSNWNEPNPPKLFLRSVAPGNNMFAAFQPYCQGVFSMFDPLDGVASEDTLSYFVAGWYSNQAEDVIGSWQRQPHGTFKDFLARARWQLAAPSDDVSTWGIYHSLVWGIPWNLHGPLQSNVPDPGSIKAAMGNTAVDALTALIEEQSQGRPRIHPPLLEALQYGLLPAYDQPDAAFELEAKIEQSWFGSRSGGYGWEIVNRTVDPSQGNPSPAPSAQQLESEADWLAGLNTAQLNYDQAVENLAALQWQLYQVWWKYNFALANGLTDPYPAGTSAGQFQSALDPANPQSLISQVNALQQQIQVQSKQIPTGATQAELDAAIRAYEKAKGLPDTRVLKQYALRAFSRAYDPVLLMEGLKVDAPLAATTPRVVRFTSQEVTGFNYKGQPITLAQIQSVIPVPSNMGAAPAELVELLYEFFLLDPTDAAMVAKAALGSTDPSVIEQVAAAMTGGKNVLSGNVAPDLNLVKWTQPWSPLVLLWDIVWYPIPHDNGGAPLWSFNGREYEWSGQGFDPSSPPWEYQGMIFLTPQASFNFREQVLKFIAENPGILSAEELKELYDFVDSTDRWDFLSQSFAGLTQLMALRDPAPNVSPAVDGKIYFPPGTTLGSLTGANAIYVPMPGPTQSAAFQTWPPSAFQNWRAGQFTVRRIYVVDRFGQTVEVVNSQTQALFTPALAPNLRPSHAVLPDNPDRFVQLPPRLLQPARLDFDYVACGDDDHVLGYAPHVNPICAWLLHNFFDETIVAYSNVGVILGALWVAIDEHQHKTVTWQAAPDAPYPTLEAMLDDPHLAHLAEALLAVKQRGPATFNSLLAAIDETSWSMGGDDPNTDIGLALLAGRPVAMVRVRLQFELEGQPVTDPSWRFTFNPQANPANGWQFNVRLGEAGMYRDGLIGYFAGPKHDTNYSQFYVPNVPHDVPDPQYVLPIGNGSSIMLPFDGSTASYLTMLADPRALIHATTGILPAHSIEIPSQFVGPAFAKMEVTFTVGPILTDTVTPEAITADDPQPTLLIPRPALKNGAWSWQEFNGTKWVELPVAPPVPTAQFSNVPARLRNGLLRLTGALGPPSKTHGPSF